MATLCVRCSSLLKLTLRGSQAEPTRRPGSNQAPDSVSTLLGDLSSFQLLFLPPLHAHLSKSEPGPGASCLVSTECPGGLVVPKDQQWEKSCGAWPKGKGQQLLFQAATARAKSRSPGPEGRDAQQSPRRLNCPHGAAAGQLIRRLAARKHTGWGGAGQELQPHPRQCSGPYRAVGNGSWGADTRSLGKKS